jgi:hypothetical protein
VSTRLQGIGAPVGFRSAARLGTKSYRRLILLSLALLGLLLAACSTPTSPEYAVPLSQAHAHNDYRHQHPLVDALEHGFTSVEVDVHLVEGQLLVAHEEYEVEVGRTLQSLYLDPLRERAQQNHGWVYPGKTQITLLIDVKTDAEETYIALRQALQEYEDILTVFGPDGREDDAVTVII